MALINLKQIKGGQELVTSIEELRNTVQSNETELNSKIEANSQLIATKADTTALEAEVSRAQAAEGVLDGRLDVLEGDVNTQGSVKKAVHDGVAEAKSYTDEKAVVINGSISALQAADVTINGRIDDMDAAYKAADVKVLSDAKNYTDGKVVEINGSISALQAKDVELEGKITEAITTAAADATSKSNNALAQAKSYTDTAVADLVDGAPEALNTLKELADALNENEGAIQGLLTQIGTKAELSYVDAELAKKADKTALEAEVSRAQGAEVALGGRIDGVVSDLAGTTTRVEKVENNVTTLTGRVDSVEQSVSDLENDLAELSAKTENIVEFVTSEGQKEFELGKTPIVETVKFYVNGIKYQSKFFTVSGTKLTWSEKLFVMPVDCDVEISFIEQV